MPRPIRSVDIYLPLAYNDAQPVEDAKFTALEDEFLDRFGGATCTHRQFPLQGKWKHGSQVFQDWVVIFNVMDFHATPPHEAHRYWERLKTKLKRRFRQLDILITVQEMLAI